MAALPEGGLARRAAVLRADSATAYRMGDLDRAEAAAEELLAMQGRAVTGESPYRYAMPALTALAVIACDRGDFDRAMERHRAALDLLPPEERLRRALVLTNMATVTGRAGDAAGAYQLHLRGLELKLRAGDNPLSVALSRNNLGACASLTGDLTAARTHLGEAVRLRRELGDRSGLASSLLNLATLERDEGDAAAARRLLTEAAVIWRDLGDTTGFIVVLEGFATLAAHVGARVRSVRLLAAAQALRETTGALGVGGPADERAEMLAGHRAALGGAAFGRHWAAGHALGVQQAFQEALRPEAADPANNPTDSSGA